MSTLSRRRRPGQGTYFTYHRGLASPEWASVSLSDFYLSRTEASLWAKPCDEHFISISLHFPRSYKAGLLSTCLLRRLREVEQLIQGHTAVGC